jgi:hypothetical protein
LPLNQGDEQNQHEVGSNIMFVLRPPALENAGKAKQKLGTAYAIQIGGLAFGIGEKFAFFLQIRQFFRNLFFLWDINGIYYIYTQIK